jgi:hypothetical protein
MLLLNQTTGVARAFFKKSGMSSLWKTFEENEQQKPKVKKWYIGKFAGRAPPDHLLGKRGLNHLCRWLLFLRCLVDEIEENQAKSDRKSGSDGSGEYSEEGNIENSYRDRSPTGSSATEETKKEKLFVRVVRGIRNKFTSRKLIGSIYVYRVSGLVSTAMRCKIGEEFYRKEFLNASTYSMSFSGEDDEEITGTYKRAVTMTDTILDSLERRSLSWEAAEFHDEVILTRGAKFTISGPFLGILGYSILIEISATVQSLVDSRKRYQAYRSSILRGMSFSMFKKKTSDSIENVNTLDTSSNTKSGTPGDISSPDSSKIVPQVEKAESVENVSESSSEDDSEKGKDSPHVIV